MKKLLVVLLSLGLIVSLSTAASAASTFRVTGAYEVFGVYNNNGTGLEDSYSRAAVWQRVRLVPFWQVDEGLSFTARIDALEKDWGDTSWRGGSNDESSSRRQNPAINQKTQENIEFERSYVTFATKVGQFMVGFQEAQVWGTKFGDYNITRPRVRWQMPFGPLTLLAVWEKNIEWDNRGLAPTGKTDADTDSYYMAGVWKQGNIEAGLLYAYLLGNTTRLTATPYKIKGQTVQPYVKATFGPVYIEAELNYLFGKTREYEIENPATGAVNQDKKGWGAYGKLQYNIGPAYVGGLIIYNSGDMDNDETEDKSGTWSKDINPAFILQNNDQPDPLPGHFANDDPGGNGMGTNAKKEQMTIYNIFAGYKASPKLTLDTSFTLAYSSATFKTGRYVGQNAGNSPNVAGYAAGTDYVSDEVGMELDVSATYKIFDNLTYMVGAGYLWTGDFFKGPNPNKKIDDDYTILHKLTLSF